MDQETAQALAEIRSELGQLRTALGATGTDEAEAEVKRLRVVTTELAQGLGAFLAALGGEAPATPEQAAAVLAQMRAAVEGLAAWGRHVTPPFPGLPAGSDT